MDDIYENIEENNPNKKSKVLIAFDDMIAEMLSNKNLIPVVTELFIRSIKVNIYLAVITKYYFVVTKNVRQNFTHNFIMKIPNKEEP